MKTFSFFDPATGELSAETVTCSDRQADANTRPGLTRIEGGLDHLSQRVDIETGDVIDYQPPAPSDLHEWDASIKRWRLPDAVVAAQAEQRALLAMIQRIEARQPRALRELMLTPSDRDARQRIADLDSEIAALRAKLK
jgi:hypothetical protein